MTYPFSQLPRTAETHFQLLFFAAVREVIAQTRMVFGSDRAVFEHYPFLGAYGKQTERFGVANWDDAVREWERSGDGVLPVLRLAKDGQLDSDALLMLFLTGLPEEDARFGALFGELNGSPENPWPTLGLLNAWWLGEGKGTAGRTIAQHLLSSQLVSGANQQAPRPAWALQPVSAVWDAMHGSCSPMLPAGIVYFPPETLPTRETLVWDHEVAGQIDNATTLLAENITVVMRGPRSNGRRTAAKVLSGAAGRGALIVNGAAPPGTGAIATLLNAMPVLVLDPEPGQTLQLPTLPCYAGPVCIVLGRAGGVAGSLLERSITIDLPIPGMETRTRLWSLLLPAANAEELSEALRCSSGTLVQVARLSSVRGHVPGPADVREAARSLSRQHLDRLAEHVQPVATRLAVPEETRRELAHLESRCRHRERLNAGSAGVRALFRGPSGTGKTLAAQSLARTLGRSLYRAQIGNLVNKYLGETEKNLDELLSRAEELDAMLLIDEGDALLAPRTGVRSSNDRYANLETNFLLQRLESFTGILIVTTNAADRIDKAFARRMDVVVDFSAPDAHTRLALWQIHLPADADVDPLALDEVAARCQLTGAQIRNAVLHATVLALEDRRPLRTVHVEIALASEYRKAGAVCPMRSRSRTESIAYAR